MHGGLSSSSSQNRPFTFSVTYNVSEPARALPLRSRSPSQPSQGDGSPTPHKSVSRSPPTNVLQESVYSQEFQIRSTQMLDHSRRLYTSDFSSVSSSSVVFPYQASTKADHCLLTNNLMTKGSSSATKELVVKATVTDQKKPLMVYFGESVEGAPPSKVLQDLGRRGDLVSTCVHPYWGIAQVDAHSSDGLLLHVQLTRDLRCTAHAMGLYFRPESISIPSVTSNPSTPRNSSGRLVRASEEPVPCELFVIWGFEAGDVVIYSLAQRAVIERLNSSSKKATVGQHVPGSAVSSIELVQNPVPPVARSRGLDALAFAQRDSDSVVGALAEAVNESANRAEGASPGSTSPPPAQSTSASAERIMNSILAAIGFDNGTVLLMHVSDAGGRFIRRFQTFGTSRITAIVRAPHDAEEDGFPADDWSDALTLSRAASRRVHYDVSDTDSNASNGGGEPSLGSESRRSTAANANALEDVCRPHVVAIGTSSGDVHVVSMPGLTKLASYNTANSAGGGFGGVMSLAWSRSWQSRILLVGAEDDTIHSLRFASLGSSQAVTSPKNGGASGPGASPNPLATTSSRMTSQRSMHKQPTRFVLDPIGGLRHHKGPVSGLAVVPTSQRKEDALLVASSQDNTLSFWHVETTAVRGADKEGTPATSSITPPSRSPSTTPPKRTAGGPGSPLTRRPSLIRANSMIRRSDTVASRFDVTIAAETCLSLFRAHSDDVVVRVLALSGCFVTFCAGGRMKVWQMEVKPKLNLDEP